jgi:hypothetical protein
MGQALRLLVDSGRSRFAVRRLHLVRAELSYSRRARGFVQKLSKKGWICKTWEGELALVTMPGTVAEKFYFSVRNDAVAQKINQSLGQRVTLTYQEHFGVPTTVCGNALLRRRRADHEDAAPLAPPPQPAAQPSAAPQPRQQ